MLLSAARHLSAFRKPLMKLIILILQIFLLNGIALASGGTKRKYHLGKPIGDFGEFSSELEINEEESDIKDRFKKARDIIESGSEQYDEIIQTVLNKPEILNHTDKDKKTLLMLAADRGITELLEVFIIYIEEETLLACDYEGCNALYLAELKDHTDAMQIILNHPYYCQESPKQKRRRMRL